MEGSRVARACGIEVPAAVVASSSRPQEREPLGLTTVAIRKLPVDVQLAPAVLVTAIVRLGSRRIANCWVRVIAGDARICRQVATESGAGVGRTDHPWRAV